MKISPSLSSLSVKVSGLFILGRFCGDLFGLEVLEANTFGYKWDRFLVRSNGVGWMREDMTLSQSIWEDIVMLLSAGRGFQ